MTGNNPHLYIVNIHDYIKFGEILSICSQDIKQKEKNMTLIKGGNFVTNKQKMTGNNSNLDLVNINAYFILPITAWTSSRRKMFENLLFYYIPTI